MKKERKLLLSQWNWMRLLILALFVNVGGVLFATVESSVFQVQSSDQNRIVVDFSSPEPIFERELMNGTAFSRIKMAGAEESSQDSLPNLPIFSVMLAIPINASYSISYHSNAFSAIQAAQPLPVGSELDRGVTLNPVYRSGKLYPETQVSKTGDAYLRDFRVLSLQTTPLSWDTEQSQYLWHQQIRITIELSYPDSQPLPYTTYSYAFKKLYQAQIANFADFSSLVQASLSPRILMIHGEYDNQIFRAQLQNFANWKRQKGFDVNLVSTAIAGSSNVAIRDYIKQQYFSPETRPDYIILIGDVTGSFAIPTWYEVESGYNGEGDYPYTYLSGDDMLGDAFIGRISAENLVQLGTILNKIYLYEQQVEINAPDSAWLDRMLIIGDPHDSGISCTYVSQHIKEIAMQANPNYSFIENYSSGFANTINQGLNQGVSFFTYRGIYGVSGWSPSTSLFNGGRLPHSVILTCDTGSFSGSALSENIIRLGTEASPAGAVSCIGMATIGTHTAMNNALMAGTMNGIFTYGMHTMGEALLFSKLRLHSLYGDTQLERLRYFAHWCNLMGDPSLEAWVGIPKKLSLVMPANIPVGTRFLEIAVLDSSATAVENVSVTAYCPIENIIIAKAFTLSDGIAVLELPDIMGTDILITAAKNGCKPEQQIVSLNPAGGIAYISQNLVENGSLGSVGNADGNANATETIALTLQIANTTSQQMGPFAAVLSTEHPKVHISQANASYSTLIAGTSGTHSTAFLFSLAADIAPVERIRFVLTLTDTNQQQHQLAFFVIGYNASLEVMDFSISSGGNSVFDAGETAHLNLRIRNSGIYPAVGLSAEMHSLSSLVTVGDSLSYFGDLLPGEGLLFTDGFELSGHSSLVPGMQIPISLKLSNAAGFQQTCIFHLPVGTVSQNTPLGPDEYGYVIYDSSDTGFPECPEYNWIEITPAGGGLGSLIPDLVDTGGGYGEGDSQMSVVLKTLELPFLFPFYGRYYDRITVCTNGYIALGKTGDGDFRNARLPGGQGPSPMIAAFWDDLYVPSGAGIYQYFDAAKRIYIIQYDKLKNGYDHSSVETFQVIFYDPLIYHTGLGDGMIKIQYKTFNNVDAGGELGMAPLQGNYCTIGIKDHTNTRGLEYSFNNQYPEAAAPLGDNTAILITTVPNVYEAAHLVVRELINGDQSGEAFLEPGETVNLGIKLLNLGNYPATDVSVTINSSSEYITLVNDYGVYPDILGGAQAVNIHPFVINVADSCPGGTYLSLACTVNIAGNSWEYFLTLEVKKPKISIVGAFFNDASADDDGILEPGETALLIVNLKNSTDVTALGIACSLYGNPIQISLIDTLCVIPRIVPFSTSQAVFRFTLPESASPGSNITLSVTYSGPQIESQSVTVSCRVGSPGLYYNFEESGSSFSSNNSGGWAWGNPTGVTAHSGNSLWATVLNGNYPDSAIFTLASPPIFIGGSSFLEFWHLYQTEAGGDGGVLQYLNSGVWLNLEPIGGYPSFVEALNTPGFSGNSDWSPARFNISFLAGRSVRFRWLFISNASNTGLGWYIDDLSITGYEGMAGSITGKVSLIPDSSPNSMIWVQNQEKISTIADSTGIYKLYLPVGQHSITAMAEGFETITISGLDIGYGLSQYEQDFCLRAYKAVSSFSGSHTEAEIQLAWEAPSEPYFPVTGYRLMRKLNAGAFEPIEMAGDMYYNEAPNSAGIYQYYVLTLYGSGQSTPSETYSVSYPFAIPPPPDITLLHKNYPNPFNPSTTIGFSLADGGLTELCIYNIKGQLVKTLWRGEQMAGYYSFEWDGTDGRGRKVASGVYFYRLTSKKYSCVNKMLLLK